MKKAWSDCEVSQLSKKISEVLSLKCGLDECTVRWICSKADPRGPQSVSQGQVGVLSLVVSHKVQFNLLINDSDEGADAAQIGRAHV